MVKYPNPFFNRLALIFLDNASPIKIPKIEIIVNVRRNCQSIINVFMSPKNPTKDWIAIINKDVLIAFFIGSFTSKTNAGTIKNPPPAPTKPAKTPIPIACVPIAK